MNEAMVRATELQFEAALGEALGHGPPDDLAARIAARLAGDARPTFAWRGRLAAAALLVLGAAVVCAVWWLQERDRARSAAAPVPAPDAAPSPDATTAMAARVAALVADLALPERRKEAMFALGDIGSAAAPLLDEALASGATRAQPDVLAAIGLARQRLALGPTARAFNLPPEQLTLICDYSDNKVRLVDPSGQSLLEFGGIFGAWDAEFTNRGTMLVTEFSTSRVRELDANQETVWEFTDLKNPYDADRLPNGNTLIADTFGSRVIEVTLQRQIVWQYNVDIRPFDADRLPNGNTLIADVLRDRVLEVSPAGEIVWQIGGMHNVHDADRLPNGNTLITLRNAGKVIEVDPTGAVVWELTGLSSPSDADRLPNGNTLVAENTQVREFDADKQVVWRAEMTWAVEANRY